MCGRESNPITDSPAALVSSSRLRVAAAPPRRRTSDPRCRRAASAASLCTPGAVQMPSHAQRRSIVKRPAHSVPSRSFGSSTTLLLMCSLKTHRKACPRHAGAVGAPAIRLLAAHVRRTFLLPEPPQPARWKPPEQEQQAERIVDNEAEVQVDGHVKPPASRPCTHKHGNHQTRPRTHQAAPGTHA